MPAQPPPDQPVNTDPEAGVAVSVTVWPAVNCAAHVDPQLIPAGELDTLPEPLPASETINVGAANAPAAENSSIRLSYSAT